MHQHLQENMLDGGGGKQMFQEKQQANFNQQSNRYIELTSNDNFLTAPQAQEQHLERTISSIKNIG